MKVSIVHGERRTVQTIALDLIHAPDGSPISSRLLAPTRRADLTLRPGESVGFVARVGAAKKRGPAPLLIELEAEEGETLADGVVLAKSIGRGSPDAPAPSLDDLFEVPPVQLSRYGDHGQYACARFDIAPALDALIMIANPPPAAVPAGANERCVAQLPADAV